MRKSVAVLLVFGLILLGVTPTLAAGERLNAAVPAQAPAREEVVQVVVPEGEELRKLDLEVFVGQKVTRTFQDFVDFVEKAAVAVVTLGDDWSGNVLDDVVGITAGLSAGIDVIDTVNCYAFGRCK